MAKKVSRICDRCGYEDSFVCERGAHPWDKVPEVYGLGQGTGAGRGNAFEHRTQADLCPSCVREGVRCAAEIAAAAAARGAPYQNVMLLDALLAGMDAYPELPLCTDWQKAMGLVKEAEEEAVIGPPTRDLAIRVVLPEGCHVHPVNEGPGEVVIPMPSPGTFRPDGSFLDWNGRWRAADGTPLPEEKR